jgi:hypothetical protein
LRGEKPCDKLEGLCCLGSEGTCFGWLFWGVPYGGKMLPAKKWQEARNMEKCPFVKLLREKYTQGRLQWQKDDKK